jgi:hypothetical protein
MKRIREWVITLLSEAFLKCAYKMPTQTIHIIQNPESRRPMQVLINGCTLNTLDGPAIGLSPSKVKAKMKGRK